MATAAATYNPDFFRRMQKFYNQRMVTSGRGPSQEELQAMMEAGLNSEVTKSGQDFDRALAQKQLELQQANTQASLALQEKQINNAEISPWNNVIGGAGTLGQLGLGYGVIKNTGLFGAKTATPTVAAVTPSAVAPVATTAPAVSPWSGASGISSLAPASIATAGGWAPSTEAITAANSGDWYGAEAATMPGIAAGLGELSLSEAAAEAGAYAGNAVASGFASGTVPASSGLWASVAPYATYAAPVAGALALDQFLNKGRVTEAITKGVGDVVTAPFKAISKACIIVTACHGEHSPEVEITREFRDRFMDKQSLRGYYRMADKIVPLMEEDPELTDSIRHGLVDNLIDYGQFALGEKDTCDPHSEAVSREFLSLCSENGAGLESYTRSNGEVI